jgi:hypothetical protein
MHVAVGEGFAGCEMEVADDLVNADAAFDTAAFAPLGVEALAVVFTLTLLDAFAATEGP